MLHVLRATVIILINRNNPNTMTNERISIANYLLDRLTEFNIKHLFGIPGDFVLPLFVALENHSITHIGTCNELNAGYAADGYARINGMGAVAATYGPGAFSFVNAVASSYAERVPVVVVSGGPRTPAYNDRLKLHHVLPEKYDASVKIFEQITEFAVVIKDVAQAPAIIDQALQTCWQRKRPVYIEIPADIQIAECDAPASPLDLEAMQTAPDALSGVVNKMIASIEQGKRTCLLPGHEIHRFGLQNKIIELSEVADMPVASLFIGKPDYLEHLPVSMGTYQGGVTPDSVREFIEGADTLLCLGAIESDFNLGGFTEDFNNSDVFWVRHDEVICPDEIVANIYLTDIVDALLAHFKVRSRKNDKAAPCEWYYPTSEQLPEVSDEPITDRYFFDRFSQFLQPNDLVAVDGGGLINSAYWQMPEGAQLVGSGYWASIGAGFGMGVGACFATGDDSRLLIVAGDGSFQMTAQELSTLTRYGKSAIVFVLNNQGYTAERVIHDGSFNDIADWKYHKLVEPFGGRGIDVHIVRDFDNALNEAVNYSDAAPLVIEVHLDPFDVSDVFKRLAATLK